MVSAALDELAQRDPAAALRTWLRDHGRDVPSSIAEAIAKVTASHDVLTMTRRSPLPGPLTDHDRKVLTEWIAGRLPVFGHGDRIRGMAERLLHLVEQLDADNKRLVETMHGVVDVHGRKPVKDDPCSNPVVDRLTTELVNAYYCTPQDVARVNRAVAAIQDFVNEAEARRG